MTIPTQADKATTTHREQTAPKFELPPLPTYEPSELAEIEKANEKEASKKASLAKFKSYLLDFNSPPPAQVPCWQFEGKPIGTMGNFMMLKGQQGTRKTFFLSGIVGAWLAKDTRLNWQATPPTGKEAVLWIDTEQSNDDAYTVMKRACITANRQQATHPANLRFAALRERGASERLELISTVLEHDLHNTGLVVIDGLSDLLATSPNDEIASNALIQSLMEWSAKYSVFIIAVLHENIGAIDNKKGRGHLGSEAERKAQLVASVAIDAENKELSNVTFTKVRKSMPPNPYGFWIDADGLPQLDDAQTPAPFTPRENKKPSRIEMIDESTHQDWIIKAMPDMTKEHSKGKLKSALQSEMKSVLGTVTGAEMDKAIDIYLNEGWILNLAEKTTQGASWKLIRVIERESEK